MTEAFKPVIEALVAAAAPILQAMLSWYESLPPEARAEIEAAVREQGAGRANREIRRGLNHIHVNDAIATRGSGFSHLADLTHLQREQLR
jgi:hypothetical protein